MRSTSKCNSARTLGVVLSTIGLCLSSLAWSDPVNIVPYGSVGPNLVDFEDVAGAGCPGVNYDTILLTGGASLAERFAGQILTYEGDNDVLSGTPTAPLTLQVGAPGQNLAVGQDTGTNGLYPYGPLGFPHPEGYGEGAFAILFPAPVSQFGLEGYYGGSAAAAGDRPAAPPGDLQAAGLLVDNTILQFFRNDGSLISIVTVSVPHTVAAFGFEREGSVCDIAGVSVHNIDGGGLGYDNLKYGEVLPTPVDSGTWGAIKARYQ